MKYLAITKKYPLFGYTLGVLTHTTAWEQHGVGDENLEIQYTWLVGHGLQIKTKTSCINKSCLFLHKNQLEMSLNHFFLSSV